MRKKRLSVDLNTAIITTKYVLDDNSPILFVYHYDEDGAWEFLGGENPNDQDYRIISLEEIINIDSTILEIIFLPIGYYAIRKNKEDKWEIHKIRAE